VHPSCLRVNRIIKVLLRGIIVMLQEALGVWAGSAGMPTLQHSGTGAAAGPLAVPGALGGRVPGRFQPAHPAHGEGTWHARILPDASPGDPDVGRMEGHVAPPPTHERRPAASFPLGRSRVRGLAVCPAAIDNSRPGNYRKLG
jgi:hypothetical protein